MREGEVREGRPASTGARLGEADMAATHSSRAGALVADACKVSPTSIRGRIGQLICIKSTYKLSQTSAAPKVGRDYGDT